ncbi:MAG: hypothetical protein ABR511_12815 [Acidimicrobiales bacterium]
MIALLIILVVAAIGGVGAYVAMQYSTPSSGTPYTSGGGATTRFGNWESRRGGALSERIADAPSGCLVAVIAAVAVWIALWAVVLVLGLRVLTA